jgi:hypothetical protein
MRVLRLLDEGSGEARGLTACIAVGSTVVWASYPRNHDCETCEAWAWALAIETAALLGFVGRETDDPTVRALVPAPGLAGLNLWGKRVDEAPPQRGWRHTQLPGCDAEGETIDQLLAAARTQLERAHGNCRRGRIPNCVTARLVAEVERLRGNDGGREAEGREAEGREADRVDA